MFIKHHEMNSDEEKCQAVVAFLQQYPVAKRVYLEHLVNDKALQVRKQKYQHQIINFLNVTQEMAVSRFDIQVMNQWKNKASLSYGKSIIEENFSQDLFSFMQTCRGVVVDVLNIPRKNSNCAARVCVRLLTSIQSNSIFPQQFRQ